MILVDYSSDAEQEPNLADEALDYSEKSITINQLNNRMTEILQSKTLTEEEKLFFHKKLLQKYFKLREEEEREKVLLKSDLRAIALNSPYKQNKSISPFFEIPETLASKKQNQLRFTQSAPPLAAASKNLQFAKDSPSSHLTEETLEQARRRLSFDKSSSNKKSKRKTPKKTKKSIKRQ